MKARLLRKLLGLNDYTIHGDSKKIYVGSPLCSELITLDVEKKTLEYAMDTFNKGRASIKHEPLEKFWDGLQALMDSGEINQVLEGEDELENPIKVYSIEKAE